MAHYYVAIMERASDQALDRLAHDRHYHLREVAEDFTLRFRRWQQADSRESVAFHLRKLMHNLIGRARDAGSTNRLRRDENLLARLHIGAMPVMDLAEALLLGQAEARDVFQVAAPVVAEIRRNQL